MPNIPHAVHTDANVAENGNFCEGRAVDCGRCRVGEGPPLRVHTQGDCGMTLIAVSSR
jgi:hypothetical protein